MSRELIAEMAWRFRGHDRHGGPWHEGAKPSDSPAMRDTFAFADAVLAALSTGGEGSGEAVAFDRVFIGETDYVRADEAVRQVMALQAEVRRLSAHPVPGEGSLREQGGATRFTPKAELRRHPDGPVVLRPGDSVCVLRRFGIADCIAEVVTDDGRSGQWALSCFEPILSDHDRHLVEVDFPNGMRLTIVREDEYDAVTIWSEDGEGIFTQAEAPHIDAVSPPSTDSLGDGPCPICGETFRDGEVCATDIELGTCHDGCLEGSPVVDLDTGEPTGGKATTFRYGGLGGDEAAEQRSKPTPTPESEG